MEQPRRAPARQAPLSTCNALSQMTFRRAAGRREAVDSATRRTGTPLAGTAIVGRAVYEPRAAEGAVLHRLVREHLETFLRGAAQRTDGGGLPHFVLPMAVQIPLFGGRGGGVPRFQLAPAPPRLAGGADERAELLGEAALEAVGLGDKGFGVPLAQHARGARHDAGERGGMDEV